MKRMLVTGGLGTIGSFLVPYFKDRGYYVISSDIHIRDYTDYMRADITSFEELYKVFKKEDIDVVIHMAARVGRMVGEQLPHKMIEVNNIGTLNLVKLCLDYDCRLVSFSTSEVYGHLFDGGRVVKEDDVELSGSPFMTTNVYAMSKLFAEAIVKHYVENYGLNAVTARPFMVYGEKEYPSKYRSAMAKFVNSALKKQKITVHKGAVRAWCYITDFIEGVRLVMEHPFEGEYEAFNIGSGEYHTMKEVAEIVVEECGVDSNLIDVVEPPSKFLSLVKRFSIEKIKNIGYEVKTSLREGIRKVVQWQVEEGL